MTLFKKSKAIILGVSLALLSMGAFAQKEDGKQRGERRGPPAEAVEACAALSTDQACSFIGRRDKDVSGMCVINKNDESQLVCKPERRKRKDREAETE